jgi:hypothetical protein
MNSSGPPSTVLGIYGDSACSIEQRLECYRFIVVSIEYYYSTALTHTTARTHVRKHAPTHHNHNQSRVQTQRETGSPPPFLFLASAHVPYRTAPPDPLSMNAIHQIYPVRELVCIRLHSRKHGPRECPAADATAQMRYNLAQLFSSRLMPLSSKPSARSSGCEAIARHHKGQRPSGSCHTSTEYAARLH